MTERGAGGKRRKVDDQQPQPKRRTLTRKSPSRKTRKVDNGEPQQKTEERRQPAAPAERRKADNPIVDAGGICSRVATF